MAFLRKVSAYCSNNRGFLACAWGMLIAAWTEGSTFALFNQFQTWYKLSYMLASVTYVMVGVGFIIAGLLVHNLTTKIGRLRVLVLAAVCQGTAQLVICTTPPFPLFLVVHTLFGAGWALQFSHFNSYAVTLDRPNEKLGLFHASFGLGATVLPLASTSFSARYRFFWFYGISLVLTLVNLTSLVVAFRGKDQEHGLPSSAVSEEAKEARSAQGSMYKIPTVWHCSAIYFLFVGAEHSVFGFLVSFLINAKGGSARTGYVLTSLYAVFSLTRAVAPRPIRWMGEKYALIGLQAGAIVLYFLMWHLKGIIAVSAIASLAGIFIGPQIPTLLVILTRNTPQPLHTQILGFASSNAMLGSTVFPFITGSVLSRISIRYMPLLPAGYQAVALCLICLLRDQKEVEKGAFEEVGLALADLPAVPAGIEDVIDTKPEKSVETV